MALIRVFVDSNELFPFSVMDLILTLAEDQLFEFVWSEELFDEWERVIVREGRRSQESARKRRCPTPRCSNPIINRFHMGEHARTLAVFQNPDQQRHIGVLTLDSCWRDTFGS